MKWTFRHVFGTAAKKEGQFTDVRPECVGQGAHITANQKFVAIALSGGGGPVSILNLDAPGRQDRNPVKLSVHKGKVLDFDFNPFIPHMIGTVSEDCYAKVSIFGADGLTENVNEAQVTLEGHTKKVTECHFHPTAANVFGTASQDNFVKVWDIEQQSEIASHECSDNVFSFDWNSNGSLMAITDKTKNLTIVDPRVAGSAQSTEVFGGSKQSSCKWMDNHGKISCVGFSKNSMRQLFVYDPKMLDKALAKIDIDQSAGVLLQHYDADNSILYLGGKGDGGIKYFEVVDEDPFCHFLSEFRTNQSQKGVCFVPKRGVNTKICEVALGLRLMRDAIVPISFTVPRKSDMFQKDIFPDTIDTMNATSTAAGYAAGENGEVIMMSMNPKDRGEDVAAEFVAKKSPAELRAELDAANARIAELEAEVAKLKA